MLPSQLSKKTYKGSGSNRIHGLFVFGAADVLSIHLKPHNFIRSYDQVFV
ncbi:hypothetical protein HanIR_Chr05g0222391 [Helianthus annuus]|nr:hypothetical protein HanIR_Chr05g0222391 [Helianthus annuus]